jgi:hypothetical protein
LPETHPFSNLVQTSIEEKVKKRNRIHIKATTASGIMFTRSSAGKSVGNGQTTRRAFRVSILTNNYIIF